MARIAASAILSVLAYSVVQLWSLNGTPPWSDEMVRAEQWMEQAIQAVRVHRLRAGIEINRDADPNGTGLIGPEDSPLMTSLGQLDAKRTTTNPEMAALLVRLLREAGVRPGDTVAIGSSGSFPALLIASLAAARAMEVRPVTVVSLGASSYGATDPRFDLLDMYSVLQESGVCPEPPVAVSLGGGEDLGQGLEPEFRDSLIAKIRSRGIPFIFEPDLSRNVARRMAVYQGQASGRLSAFINSGGGYANLGTSELVLRLTPGLNREVPQPAAPQRGMIHEMAARNIPIIHLLYIKGLVQNAGLPWDPVPLPGRNGRAMSQTKLDYRFWLVCGAYFILLAVIATSRVH